MVSTEHTKKARKHPKSKRRVEFRYYDIPKGSYVLSKLGKGWELEYGRGDGAGLHFHNYMEVGYCYHGRGRLLIEDRVYRYGDGMFSVIPANIPHTTISDAGNICKWEFLFLDADNFIQNEMRNLEIWGGYDAFLRNINSRGTLKTAAHHPALSDEIRAMIRECRRKNPYFEECLKGHLYSFFIDVFRLNEERENRLYPMPVNAYIREAIHYVTEHFSEEITISHLANVIGLSESHFRRMFEESMKMKPTDYINFVRVDHACDLLRKSDLTVEQIGYRVGYQTPSTFNRNFKAITGTTPLRYKAGGNAQNRSRYLVSALPGWEFGGE